VNLGWLEIGKLAKAIVQLGSALSELFTIDVDNAGSINRFFQSIAAAGEGVEKLKASAAGLQSLERVIKVSTELDAANVAGLQALAQVTSAPPQAAGGGGQKKYSIPITFAVNNSMMQKYVVDIVNEELNVTRVR
jgi:hypothetical protein